MTAYYNEIDKHAAQWLRNLIDAGHIAPGYVDDRSIEDVFPSDLRGFTQCHFFAGIGVWSYALRQSGWSDDRHVWTGSCPCQPFSAAGKGAGFSDERHLWPAFFHLIQECKPAVVFGEQVASKDANPWIDLVQTDLEAVGYGVGAVAFPAAGIGAPHIRDRLYWVGHASSAGLEGLAGDGGAARRKGPPGSVAETGISGGVADAESERRAGQLLRAGTGLPSDGVAQDRDFGWMADTAVHGHLAAKGSPHVRRVEQFARWEEGQGECLKPTTACSTVPWGLERPCANPTNGHWRDADWLLCRDGKWRPVEPGTFPLVDGAPARVVRLRAYGNAINAKAAQALIECVM